MVVLLWVHPGFVMVHARTVVPVVNPVMVETPSVGVVIVPPGPETMDQVPSPDVGILPVSVVVVLDMQSDWVPRVVAILGALFTTIESVEVVIQTPFEVV